MTKAFYTNYAAHNAKTITVETQEELNNAFKTLAADGGGTIELSASGNPYTLAMRNMNDDGEENAILLKSADIEDPAVFSQVNLNNVSHVTFDSLNFDHSSIGVNRAISDFDVRVSNSDHIEFTNNVMTGTASGRMTHEADAIRGGNFAIIRDTDDIVFSGNTVSDFFHGIAFFDVNNVVIDANDISAIQGDGIRGGGVHQVEVTNNYLHDFFGAVQTVTHNDMIQFWGRNAKEENSDILIDGNILDAGDGASTQGIFIRNEQFGESATAAGHFENITITNNIVYNGSHHGISVSDTRNAVVANNTVLWNQDAHTQISRGSELITNAPWVSGENNLDSVFENNTGSRIRLNGEKLHDTNLAIDYSNAATDTYVDAHIENYRSGVAASDMTFKTDSPFAGIYGAIRPVETEEVVVEKKTSIASSVLPPPEASATLSAEGVTPATGYVKGTSFADRFVFKEGERGDVVSGGGADIFVVEGASTGKLHRVRDFDTDQTVDVSAMLTGFDETSNPHDFVQLQTATWGGKAHTIIKINADGGVSGAGFEQTLLLKNVSDLNLDELIETGVLYLGAKPAAPVIKIEAPAVEAPIFKQPVIDSTEVDPPILKTFSKEDVGVLETGTTPFWMKDGALAFQDRMNELAGRGGYATSPVIERLTEDDAEAVIEFTEFSAANSVFDILEDIMQEALASFSDDLSAS